MTGVQTCALPICFPVTIRPSTVYGIITPGQPIYQGGLDPATIKTQLEQGSIKPQDVSVIGRQGGHSIVMDDGDLEGNDQLIRIRTSKGHQITMSDDGNCFYIIHANGQAWIEMGQEGTVDVFATNSVNVRTNGTINMHADKDINMFAGGKINVKSMSDMTLESQTQIIQSALEKITVYSKNEIGIRADGSLGIKSKDGSWNAGSKMVLRAGRIDLNGGAAKDVPAPTPLTSYTLDDTEFDTSTGWIVTPGALESIVTRAPTHEPYPYHNQGVDVQVDFEEGQPSPPPGAPPVPGGWSFTVK